MTTYQAIKCPCGHKTCKAWMVDPIAAIQGVSFTREQAVMVAIVLNAMEIDQAAVRRIIMHLARAV